MASHDLSKPLDGPEQNPKDLFLLLAMDASRGGIAATMRKCFMANSNDSRLFSGALQDKQYDLCRQWSIC